MESPELGAWLRRQREARCWARSEMARRLIKAAHAIGDRSITDISNLCHNIYRWERSTVVPGERYKLYYCQAFGLSPSEYGIEKTETEVPISDLAMTALDLLAAKLGLRSDFDGQTLIIWSDQPHRCQLLAGSVPASRVSHARSGHVNRE